jgi:16S rRNA (cytidine1402-2'-O)-methyltransferase
VPVVPIPGASAIAAFLPVTGLPTDRFAFEGFLPARAGERRRKLVELAGEPRTLLFYESGRRLAAALGDMASVFGARRAAVGRELTKMHEEIARDDLAALAASFAERDVPGEVVVAVAGAPARDPAVMPEDLDDEIRRRRASGATLRDVAETVARERGLNRRAVYRKALALEREPS